MKSIHEIHSLYYLIIGVFFLLHGRNLCCHSSPPLERYSLPNKAPFLENIPSLAVQY